MRIGYDSVPLTMPNDGDVYMGYVDGLHTAGNFAKVAATHPGKRLVKITVTGNTLDAQMGDIENGDMTPQSGAAWAKRKIDAHQIPTLYMSDALWPQVVQEVAALGLTGKVCYAVAHYDGVPVIPGGAIAKQFLGDYHGYDKWVIAGHWPGVDPAPKPPAEPGWFSRILSFPPPTKSHEGVTARVNLHGKTVIMQVGSDVKIVQRKVGAKPDGFFGPDTRDRVSSWQRHHGLRPDGDVGPDTALKMGP